MARDVVLDTGVIIGLERHRLAPENVYQLGDQLAISAITTAELLVGVELAPEHRATRIRHAAETSLNGRAVAGSVVTVVARAPINCYGNSMHPFLPNDVQMATGPEVGCNLDDVRLMLTDAENYHYVRAAGVRQGPLLGRAVEAEVFDLVREFVLSEGTHEHYFLSTLARWGIPAAQVKATIPLTGTAQFIALQHRLAHVSVLDYLAGSATLEVDPDVYSRVGDPYAPWEETYGIDPEILAPVREHIRADVDGGHSHLFRLAALATGQARLPLAVARSAFTAAWTVFEATRVWQRECSSTIKSVAVVSAGTCSRPSV